MHYSGSLVFFYRIFSSKPGCLFNLYFSDKSKFDKILESLEFTVYPFLIIETFSHENFCFILSFTDLRVFVTNIFSHFLFTNCANIRLLFFILGGINFMSLVLLKLLFQNHENKSIN